MCEVRTRPMFRVVKVDDIFFVQREVLLDWWTSPSDEETVWQVIGGNGFDRQSLAISAMKFEVAMYRSVNDDPEDIEVITELQA